MARYFFDLVKNDETAHDFQGREFGAPEQARRQGELIAIDLQLSSDDWAGGRVLVRDPHGRELFAIAVPQAADS
jgi:hypothetical protein